MLVFISVSVLLDKLTYDMTESSLIQDVTFIVGGLRSAVWNAWRFSPAVPICAHSSRSLPAVPCCQLAQLSGSEIEPVVVRRLARRVAHAHHQHARRVLYAQARSCGQSSSRADRCCPRNVRSPLSLCPRHADLFREPCDGAHVCVSTVGGYGVCHVGIERNIFFCLLKTKRIVRLGA